VHAGLAVDERHAAGAIHLGAADVDVELERALDAARPAASSVQFMREHSRGASASNTASSNTTAGGPRPRLRRRSRRLVLRVLLLAFVEEGRQHKARRLGAAH
jgi:hypothetical protein